MSPLDLTNGQAPTPSGDDTNGEARQVSQVATPTTNSIGTTHPDGPSSSSQTWHVSDRFDSRALPLADRHYNRRAVGSPQFVPPGRCLVLLTADADAVWVTSWPFAEYVRHAWPGAWVCSIFRNESPHLSSSLIRQAVAATVARWPEIPRLGMITFVDAGKTRRKRDPGRCYRKAGFHHVGFTKGGLWALQMLPEEMPPPMPAVGSQAELGVAA